MHLSRYQTATGPRWAADGYFLPSQVTLSFLLELPAAAIQHVVKAHLITSEDAVGAVLPPVDPQQEVWASGVTYLRSRDARKAESTVADVYQKVYDAERPELFLKAVGWRAVANGQPVAIRPDSTWDVPEPELVLVINRFGEIVGYTAGNDMSSRSIEGENPLYLPQAKSYDGCAALGPCILVAEQPLSKDTKIELEINRDGKQVFAGDIEINQIKRGFEELAGYLFRECSFSTGALLMTGTGIVPDSSFTLKSGDEIVIHVEAIGTLVNKVA